ncbi:MAG: FixH family protein [Caldilineaceae bacterium]|nr:FixH family protein [Caldilineaceae bacterium]
MNRCLLKTIGLALLMLLPAACGRVDNSAAASGLQVTLTTEQGYPGEALVVAVADEAGRPVTDMTVSVEGNMNHAGMVPVLTPSVLDEADGAKDGRYTVPFQFTMLGDWIITVKLSPRDGETLTQDVDVSVSSDAVKVMQ